MQIDPLLELGLFKQKGLGTAEAFSIIFEQEHYLEDLDRTNCMTSKFIITS